MREIELISVRMHKVELTWDLVDELLEHVEYVEYNTYKAEDIEEAWGRGYDDAREEYECLDIENHSYDLDQIIAEEVANATRETGS